MYGSAAAEALRRHARLEQVRFCQSFKRFSAADAGRHPPVSFRSVRQVRRTEVVQWIANTAIVDTAMPSVTKRKTRIATVTAITTIAVRHPVDRAMPISSARALRAWSAPSPARAAPTAAPSSTPASIPTANVPSAALSFTVANSAGSSTPPRSSSARSPSPNASLPRTFATTANSTSSAPPSKKTPRPRLTHKRAQPSPEPAEVFHPLLRVTTTLARPSRICSKSKYVARKYRSSRVANPPDPTPITRHSTARSTTPSLRRFDGWIYLRRDVVGAQHAVPETPSRNLLSRCCFCRAWPMSSDLVANTSNS